MPDIRRRDFITLVGGAAVWPRAATAQEAKRVGVLMGWRETDPDAKLWLSAFTQGLSELGWTIGRNLRMDVRWSGEGIDQARSFAKELVDLQPDVILSSNTPETASVQRETRSIPIVFVSVSDPVGSGFVADFPRPGSDLTGFALQEPSMSGKLLELLTEIAPGVKRAAFMFNPETAPYVQSYYLPVYEAVAQSLKVAPTIAPVHDEAEIETVIASLGREPGAGLIGAPDRFISIHRAAIIASAARHKIPATYGAAGAVSAGGLLFYGPDFVDQFHRAADYVHRILHGAKPTDLPVQLPVKFVMGLNVKTAKALGLTVPQSIFLRADEVAE
jgi:putative ABC transport system substrate-binding protein